MISPLCGLFFCAPSTYKFIYDAWGRLRQAKKISDNAIGSEYRYIGLGYRVGWHYDVDTSTAVDDSDPWYIFVYNERWQKLATFRATIRSSGTYAGNLDSDTTPKELFVMHAAGQDGLGSSSYIDSLVLRDADLNGGGDGWGGASDGTLEDRKYYLQNWRADVVAMARTDGYLEEQIRYSAYGTPTIFQRGDIADDTGYPLPSTGSNGGVNEGDYNYFYQEFFNGDSHTDMADDSGFWLPSWGVNNGVNEGDYNFFSAAYWESGVFGRGALSNLGNRHGYAGYEYDPILTGGYYHVRHRVYDSGNGRWTRRDPLGYVDGMNLYSYVGSMPLIYLDPTGLLTGLAGCLLGGAIDGAASYISCLLRWWDWDRNCLLEAACGALAGCVAGFIQAQFPSLAANCLAGLAESLIQSLCNGCIRSWLKGERCAATSCDVIRASLATAVSCLGVLNPNAKQSLILMFSSALYSFFGLDCAAVSKPSPWASSRRVLSSAVTEYYSAVTEYYAQSQTTVVIAAFTPCYSCGSNRRQCR